MRTKTENDRSLFSQSHNNCLSALPSRLSLHLRLLRLPLGAFQAVLQLCHRTNRRRYQHGTVLVLPDRQQRHMLHTIFRMALHILHHHTLPSATTHHSIRHIPHPTVILHTQARQCIRRCPRRLCVLRMHPHQLVRLHHCTSTMAR